MVLLFLFQSDFLDRERQSKKEERRRSLFDSPSKRYAHLLSVIILYRV